MSFYSKEDFLKELNDFCDNKTTDFCSDTDCEECAFVLMSEKIKAEKKKLDVAVKLIKERLCFDDCGFNPEKEKRETLCNLIICNDEIAREFLKRNEL